MSAKSFKRVLFLGIGGGNDVFSCVLAARSLWNLGWRWDDCSFAGVLSPFHTHSTSDTGMVGVSLIRPNSQRWVARMGDSFRIGFVDAAVANLIQKVNILNARDVYGISLRQGTVGVSFALKALAKTHDYVVLVDVGGDVFYRGREDAHVLSPLFDSMVLKGFVDSGVPGELFEAGPGTDGELEPEAMEQVLAEAGADAYPLSKDDIREWNTLYEGYIAPVRPGRTVPETIRAFHSTEEVITLDYRARGHLGKMRFYANFPQRIKTALCKQFFLVDPKRIKNPFAVICGSPLHWFLRTQDAQWPTNCEANMEYFNQDGEMYQFLTPSPLLAQGDRLTLIIHGLHDLTKGAYNKALMFPADWDRIKPTGLQGSFMLNKMGNMLVIEPS